MSVLRAAQALTVDDPRNRCVSLVYRDVPGLKILRAAFIAEGVAYPLNWATRRIAGDALPAHCLVSGQVDTGLERGTTTGPGSPSFAPVAFEARLPTRWNGRFFYQGSDDTHEGVPEAFGRNTGAGGFDDNALSSGFAVLSSDVGRPAAGPGAAGDGEGSLQQAALGAQALIKTYYGKLPDRSYFVGCSAGGREGLLIAQRWPALFDGIVAVAPTLRETDAALAAAWTLQRFMAVAPRVRKRQTVLSRAFSTEELFMVAQGILKQCDALDGVEDGFVMDMAACRFDPAILQCARGKRKGCLQKDEVAALADAMAGPRGPQGQPLYAPWPWDPGIAAPGWRAWNLGDAGPGMEPDARHLAHASQALALAGPPGPVPNALTVDFSRDLPRLQAARDADAAFVDAPLEAFRQRWGKLLLLHGAADPVVSAWATVDYLQRLRRAPVDTQAPGDTEFARAFIVPGMNHCAGGPATDRFDALAALVDWVEFDRAPDRIEAHGSAVLHDESRPLCPWPKVARYRGEGNVHHSASHVCR
jgi:feruloyl esterase